MYICEEHDCCIVVYNTAYCPVCGLEDECDGLEQEIVELQDSVSYLEAKLKDESI